MLRCGWAVHYVEQHRMPFAYTVGLHERGLPELLVTGVSAHRARRLLDGVAGALTCDSRTRQPVFGCRRTD